jgi:hypothetical protein
LADHAWDIAAANLSGTTLADLGNNETKWNLTRINNAGFGTLVFNGVTYPCGTFDGVNQSWQTVLAVASLASSPFIWECLFVEDNAIGTQPVLCQRTGNDYIVQIFNSNLLASAHVHRGTAYTSSSAGPIATSTTDTYLVQAGLGTDRKAFITVNGSSLVAVDAIPGFFSNAVKIAVGTEADSAGASRFKGKIGQISIHQNLFGSSTELAAISQQRYADYMAGRVTDFKTWVGL